MSQVIKITLTQDQLLHLAPQQYGAMVAWVMKCASFHAIRVESSKIEIEFRSKKPTQFASDYAEIAMEIQKIYDEIDAFTKLDPFPCPCGCGAFIMLDPCFRQSEANFMLANGLTQAENDAAKNGRKIEAIKMVRVRTNLGLKDAKDIVDKAFPGIYTHHHYNPA